MKHVLKPLPLKILNDRLIYSCDLLRYEGERLIRQRRLVMDIGSAWLKRTPAGRPYYKMKYDVLRNSVDQPVYAKAWSRQSDPTIFDSYSEKRETSDIKFHSRRARDVSLPLNGKAVTIDGDR